MNRVTVLPFRWNSTIPEIISKEFIEFYIWVAKSIQDDSSLALHAETFFTIPIPNKILDPFIPDELVELFKTNAPRHEDADLVIIDLSNPPRGTYRAAALRSFFQSLQAWAGKRHQLPLTIVLLRDLPLTNEFLNDDYESLVRSKNIIFIDNNGDYRAFARLNSTMARWERDEYVSRLANARFHGDTLALLRKKMIRRLGHYEREPDLKHIRFYYDGEDCQYELAFLFEEYVKREYRNEPPQLILYSPSIARWLEGPVRYFARRVKHMRVDKFVEETLTTRHLTSPILLIVPIVDSGDTLLGAIKSIREKYGELKLRILTVLTTNPGDARERVRYLTDPDNGNKQIRISYLLEVKQLAYHPSECPMCRLKIPQSGSQHHQDDYIMLTSYDMWNMVEETGWAPEDYGPDGRPLIPEMPSLAKIFRWNGAWLASKFRLRLEHDDHYGPDPVVICPKETNIQILAEALRDVINIGVIPIPRDEIDKIGEIRSDVDWQTIESKWERDNPSWYVQLRHKYTPQELILVDEFTISGETRRNLVKLVQHLNKGVSCYFSFIDFNPRDSHFMNKKKHIHCICLYDFQL